MKIAKVALIPAWLWAFVLPLAAAGNQGEVVKLDFAPGKESSRLTVHFSGNGQFRVFQSERQGSVIVEAENLRLPPALSKAIDGSASGGPVLQVTPYSAGDSRKPMAKIVVQLRGLADVETTDLPGKFVLDMKRKRFDVGAAEKKKGASSTASDELRARDAANEKGEDVAKKLVDVLNAPPEEKKYFGSRVTFEGNKVDVHDIFRLVGVASNLNIITDGDVRYVSDYSLKDIPWDQLLDIVMQQAQLKAAVSGNVVRIYTLAKFNAEQEAKLREIGAADEMEPVVMAVIPLSFAAAEEMRNMIDTLLVKRDTNATNSGAPVAPAPQPSGVSQPTANVVGGQASGAAGQEEDEQRLIQDFVRGQIQVDTRSNSLVVTNTRETIERIRKLVKELDVPLPQVLIDSKIIVATETFAKTVGMRWEGRTQSSGSGRAGTIAGFNKGTLTMGDPANSPELTVTPGTETGAGGALGFRIGAGTHGYLNAALDLAEANDVSKTIASPRVIVNNKTTATITDGQTLLLPTAAGANTPGDIREVQANLTLTVTPQVTSSGSVQMDVNISKGSLLPSGNLENKQMQTKVLVDSGSTLVLGGVYQFTQLKGERGIPLLKDLPFIGQLFRTNSDSNGKTEMMVFVTPQIIEASEKGATPGANL